MALKHATLDWTPERRRALRVEVPPRRAGVVRGDGDASMALREVSESGLLVEGDTPIRPDTACDVTIVVEARAPLTLTGRVVYCRTAGVPGREPRARYVTALALEGVRAEEREALRAIVAELAGGHAGDAAGEALPPPSGRRWPS
jgi:hypothetical protein